MSSGWEITADILGAASAGFLLIPAFGENAIRRLVAKARVSVNKWKQGPDPIAAEDLQRAEAALEKAEKSGERWSTWDELILRLAAGLFMLSYVAKGLHYWLGG